MNSRAESKRRSWNGYGLSLFKCGCGAARKVTRFTVEHDCLKTVHAEPCKRCGSEATVPDSGWPSDPWLYIGEEIAA